MSSILLSERYYYLIDNDKYVRQYLLGKCFKKNQPYCLRCQNENLYKLKNGKYRCSHCAYTFHDFSGRWINRCKLSFVQWLTLIWRSKNGFSVLKMARSMKVSYQAAYNAIWTIRLAILSQSDDVKILLDRDNDLADAFYGGRYKDTQEQGNGKISVFGIKEQNDQVQIRVVPKISAEDLLRIDVRKVLKGNIVYTGRYEGYDSLIFCGYRELKLGFEPEFTSGKVYIDNTKRFWRWAKKRLIKRRGFTKTRFPLVLKELEFRYNNRNNDNFDLIATYLCDLVPNRNGTTNKKGKA